MGIECCVNSGKCNPQSMCPKGIGWDLCLGEAEDFDPEMLWIATPEIIEGMKNIPKLEKQWWNNE